MAAAASCTRPSQPDAVVGRSAAMARLFELVRKVAPTQVHRADHRARAARARKCWRGPSTSRPAGERFLAVNCAAIPHDLLENQLFGHRKGAFTGADRDSAGMFVHAGDGTVFLDEIAELPLATQAKLLRAIEQKEVLPVGANEPVRVEARVLAATNKSWRPRSRPAGSATTCSTGSTW